MVTVKVNLCQECAGKLREILARDGEAAMARAIGTVLCAQCKERVPGHVPGMPLKTGLKVRS